MIDSINWTIRVSITVRLSEASVFQLLSNYRVSTVIGAFQTYSMILYSHERSISTYRISNLESQSNLDSTPQFSQTNRTESWTNSPATRGATPQQTHCQLTHPPTSRVAVPLFLERPARSQTWRRPSKFAKSPFVLSSPLHENPVLLQCPLHAPQSPSLSHSPTGLHGWGFWSKLP